MSKVDLEFSDLTSTSDVMDDDASPDPLESFLEDARLAGAIGKRGFERVEDFRAEAQERSAAFAARFQRIEKARAKAQDDWNEEIDAGNSLGKRFGGIQRGLNTARIERKGALVYEYDSRGELLRAYVDEAA